MNAINTKNQRKTSLHFLIPVGIIIVSIIILYIFVARIHKTVKKATEKENELKQREKKSCAWNSGRKTHSISSRK